MIADYDIPFADSTEVIKQYEPYIQKIANRYLSVLQRSGAVDMEDLLQAGRIAVIDAQKMYKPEKGLFIHYLFYHVRAAIKKTLGFDNQTGAAPKQLIYLDAPLSDDPDLTLGDTIQDPDLPPMDEPIINDESRRETAEQIRAALDRMKSDKQRVAISLVWLDGKNKKAAAEELNMKLGTFYSIEKAARSTLRRDFRLKHYATQEMPFFHVGVMRYKSTWTSATEAAVIWRDMHIFGNDSDMCSSVAE